MLACLLMGQACDRDEASALKGQTNTTLTFHGQAVDQDGHALPGAHFEYRLEAYPKDWTFDTRGRPNEALIVTATSDEAGRFQMPISGCKLIRLKAERVGYRHLCETDHREGDNFGYTLIAWGDLWYKSDPAHPAVYVFVKDGEREVSALPCRGGYDSGGGTRWTLNQPAWPKKPSLKDVVQKHPATTRSTS
jgi:hypothetical protein